MAYDAKATWAVPLAICCLLMTLFMIAGTIVLALIPVYLSAKNINVDTTQQEETLLAGYASNQVGARSDTLADTSSLSTQLVSKAGLSSDNIALRSGNFLSETAAARKKRQTTNSNGTITCGEATGLTSGDIFVAQYQIIYPVLCFTACRNRYKTKIINSLRMNYQRITVVMNFTIAGIQEVQLVFCGIFSIDSTGCTTESKTYAYLMDTNNTLYQFNPINFNIAQLGTISCATSSNLYSIALQRNGILWAAFADGNLFTYNIRSGVCRSTIFAANQSNFTQFTMTFVKSSTDTSETLYVSQHDEFNATLGKIDLTTFALSVVGNYSELDTYADLAGTNDGRLFGLFNARPYTIAQIDITNAQILSQYPLNRSSDNDTNPNYGFTVYNTRFFVFEGNGNYSDLLTFDLSTNTTTLQNTIPQIISGATSSSCLGAS